MHVCAHSLDKVWERNGRAIVAAVGRRLVPGDLSFLRALSKSSTNLAISASCRASVTRPAAAMPTWVSMLVILLLAPASYNLEVTIFSHAKTTPS